MKGEEVFEDGSFELLKERGLVCGYLLEELVLIDHGFRLILYFLFDILKNIRLIGNILECYLNGRVNLSSTQSKNKIIPSN